MDLLAILVQVFVGSCAEVAVFERLTCDFVDDSIGLFMDDVAHSRA
jgi:hypothetical protein